MRHIEINERRVRRGTFFAAIVALGVLALAPATAAAQTAPAPGDGFRKVSELVELPEFVPGLGVLYVDPATLPAGPFLAYDREGELLSTIYMVPLDDLNARKKLAGLDAAAAPVDHVDFVFNAGHPGVPEPHYHVILWHVSARKAGSLGG